MYRILLEETGEFTRTNFDTFLEAKEHVKALNKSSWIFKDKRIIAQYEPGCGEVYYLAHTRSQSYCRSPIAESIESVYLDEVNAQQLLRDIESYYERQALTKK